VDLLVPNKISGPKVVAIGGMRQPWFIEIEKRLIAKGFQVKRMATQNVAIEKTSENKTDVYNEASTRYILMLNADIVDRCFGGGYRFRQITAEIIDVNTNQTIMSYSNGGLSEDCPPCSGSIYSDIAQQVANIWQ
jgi:hypothetical protein